MKTIRYRVDNWSQKIIEANTHTALEHYLYQNSDSHDVGELEAIKYRADALSKIVAQLLDQKTEAEIIDILGFSQEDKQADGYT